MDHRSGSVWLARGSEFHVFAYDGAWIASDSELIRLTTAGEAVSAFDYAQPGNLVEFVVDSMDGSLWVASQQYLRHYSPSGAILSELVLVGDTNEGRIWSLAMYIDDLPPSVRFVAPDDATLTNNSRLPSCWSTATSVSGLIQRPSRLRLMIWKLASSAARRPKIARAVRPQRRCQKVQIS